MHATDDVFTDLLLKQHTVRVHTDAQKRHAEVESHVDKEPECRIRGEPEGNQKDHAAIVGDSNQGPGSKAHHQPGRKEQRGDRTHNTKPDDGAPGCKGNIKTCDVLGDPGNRGERCVPHEDEGEQHRDLHFAQSLTRQGLQLLSLGDLEHFCPIMQL